MSDLKIVKLIDPIQLVNILGGLVPKGAYDGATSYVVGDSVDYNGSSYVLFASAVAGTLPTDTTKWQVVANKGDQGIQGNDGVAGAAGANGLVTSIVGGTNITVDNTTPSAPIVNVTGLTKSSVGLGNVENAAASTLYVPLAGGTMTGALVVSPTNTASIAISGNNAAGSTAKLMSLSLGGAEAFDVSSSGQLNVRNITPRSSLSHNLGAASTYWTNLYAQTLNLNSTASISGTTAGELIFTGNPVADRYVLKSTAGIRSDTTAGLLRLSGGTQDDGAVLVMGGSTNGAIASTGVGRVGTTDIWKWNAAGMTIGNGNAPTHTLTLPSIATGIALYNTSDQTTNFERVRQYWASNVFNISAEKGGTGADRSIKFSSTLPAFQYLQINSTATSGFINSFGTNSAAGGIIHLVNGTNNATSGVQYGVSIAPTINQTGTAGYTTLLINPTETAVGSGAKFLGDFQVGGVRKASIDNTGAIMVTGFDAALSTKTANYTLIVSDYTILFDATAGNLVATLPTAASSTGRVYNIKKMDSTANTVTIDANASETIDGALTKVISTQFNSYTIQSTGTAWVVL